MSPAVRARRTVELAAEAGAEAVGAATEAASPSTRAGLVLTFEVRPPSTWMPTNGSSGSTETWAVTKWAPPSASPLQPLNSEPALARAVNVTTVPSS